MNNLFFQLLQVAIGNRKELTRQLSADEWVSLYSICKKQSLIGIGYFTITRLPKEQRPPLRQFAQWIHDAEKIKEKNMRISADCAALCKKLEHDGMNCCIIKGQSNLVNYRPSKSPLKGDLSLADYRTPGDIDVLIRPKDGSGVRGAIEYCIGQCNLYKVPVGKICYHHMDIPFPHDTLRYDNDVDRGNGANPKHDTGVEAHHRATWLNSYFKNRRLQSWLEANMPFGLERAELGKNVFPIPSPEYNVIYQLLHISKHLFEEGIGLRQMLDYYFVLKALPSPRPPQSPCLGGRLEHQSIEVAERLDGTNAFSNEEIMHTLSRFGMEKFASAVMYVLQKVFEPLSLLPNVGEELQTSSQDKYEDWHKHWPWMLCKPNEKEGKFLLNEIMMAGNFGKYDERIKRETPSIPMFRRKKVPVGVLHNWEKTKHNLRLLSHYPEEVMWEPMFRLYHYFWRRFELWKY